MNIIHRHGPARLFICYAHQSQEHKDQVRELAELLTEEGLHVELDQWAGTHRRDWQLWATGNILHADFVLVIASAMCRRVGDGMVKQGQNRGLRAELALLREWRLRNPEAAIRRMLPVVLPGQCVDDIPLFLQPYAADHYIVSEMSTEGADELLRALTSRPRHTRPPLGGGAAVTNGWNADERPA